MKKIIYFVAALIYFSCFCECKVYSQDGPKKRHLAFMDSTMRKKLRDSSEKYAVFLSNFKVVPIEKFNEYHSNFVSMFNTSFSTPCFSIFGKYQDFQFNLNIQNQQVTEAGITYENKIRIYPAITRNNTFYLVLLKELHDITTTPPPPYSQTSKIRIYSIEQISTGSKFTEIPPGNDVVTAMDDIKRFQIIIHQVATVQKPALTFTEEKSFSYSIADYDQLLGASFPYWDVDSEKTNSNSSYVVRIFPGLDADDPANVKFRLMLRLYTVTPLNLYREVRDKAIFDNIDPCPNVCPTNPIP